MPKIKKINNKSYTGVPFNLSLPTIHSDKDKIVINTSIKFNGNKVKEIVLTDVIVENRPNKLFTQINAYIENCASDFPLEIIINKTSPISTIHSIINIHFVANNNEGYSIVYQVDKTGKCLFLKSIIEELDGNERNIIENIKKEETLNRFGDGFKLGKTSLDLFMKKVLQEMFYLRDSGGKKLKVSNGTFISTIDSMYSYSFDLESELYVSDDSPVTLHLTGKDVNGTVLMCEGFQIILLLDQYIDKNVSSAHLSVAPWKILQALHKKLSLLDKSNKIAMQLIDNNVNTKGKSIYDIPMGQGNAVINSITYPISIIWGPPGTGKTYTMARIAKHFLNEDKTILMVSHSNISVDGLISELYKQIVNGDDEKLNYLVDTGRILRYGFVRGEELSKNDKVVAFNIALNHNPSLKKRREELLEKKDKLEGKITPEAIEIEKQLKEIKTEIKKKEKTYVKNARLIATTISKGTIDKEFDNMKFDVVMFDEASMAYVPQIFEAAMFANEHFICVGDFRQLAPISQSDAKNYLSKDIFLHLGIIDEFGDLHYHPWLTMLNEQRRMHPDISKFSSLEIYDGLLKDYPDVKTKRCSIVTKGPFAGSSMTLIDTTSTYNVCKRNSDNSRFNILNALLSFQIALDAVNSGQDTVGIITPYQAQSRLIQALISDYDFNLKKKMICSTVHQFQGSERDVIIFDSVESHPYEKPGILMHKNDNDSLLRLINVALTRARGKFITLANKRYWDNIFKGTNHTYEKLLNHMENENRVISNKDESLKNLFDKKRSKRNIRCYIDDDYARELLKDLDAAEDKIILSIPTVKFSDTVIEKIVPKLIEMIDWGVEVIIKTNDYINIPDKLKEYTFLTEEHSLMPLILIDDSILWYGAIMNDGKMPYKTKNYFTKLKVSYRIIGEKTVEIIKSLTDLEGYISLSTRKQLTFRKGKQVLISDGKKQLDGLSLYIHENTKCSKCGKPMNLHIGKYGKPSVKCQDLKCGNSTYLNVNDLKSYISENNIRCPKDNGLIKVGLSAKGIWLKCEHGHFINIIEII